MAISSAAAAQAAGSPPAVAANAPQTADATATAGGAIGEILVTAQRRAESLQVVPLSVVAIGAEQLRTQDVTNVDRLEQIAPGLRIGRSGSDPRPAMRGTFTSAIQGNNDPRFGIYIDDIYQSRTSQLSVPFVDLERVEVQKGPQGTLYGRNSFGGNIAITTAEPRDKFDAGLDLVYGNYNRKLVEGFINVPLADDFAVRVAGAFEDRGGYINNTYNSQADADDKHQYYIRGSARWDPAAFDHKLEVVLHAAHWDENDHGNGAFGSKPIGALFNSAVQVAPGGTLTLPGASPITLPGGYSGLDQTSSTLVPYYVFYRDGKADINGADIGLPIPGPYTLYNDYQAHQRLISTNLSMNISYDLGDFARIKSITGYTNFSAFRTRDADGTPAPKGIGYFITKDKSFSQELQFQSANKSSPFQYTAGLYYFNDAVPDAYIGEENRGYSTANAIATGGFPIYFNNYTYSPLVNYAAPLTNNIGSQLVTAARSDSVNPLTYLKTISEAAYLQASYTFDQKLTFTGGIRYTRDKKTFYSALQQAATGGTFAFSPGFGITPSTNFNLTCDGYTAADPSSTATNAAQALLTRCGNNTFKFFTYRAAVDYKLEPDKLLYASFDTGKHAGGFSYSPRPGATTLNPVDTENVVAFEIGSKNQFFNGRLQVNLDAYYNHYTNLQVSVSYPNPLLPGSVSTYSQNGQSNSTPGIDFEVIAKPTRSLTLNFAANYMHARDNPVLISGASSNGLCAIGTSASCPLLGIGLGGGILPNVVSNPALFVLIPGTTASYNSLAYNQKARVQDQPDITVQGGATYDLELANHGHLIGEWQTYFNGGYLLFVNTPNFMQKSFTKTELRLTYQFPDNHLSIQGFVENLENNAVINRVTFSTYTYDGNYEAPRTYGARVAWKY